MPCQSTVVVQTGYGEESLRANHLLLCVDLGRVEKLVVLTESSRTWLVSFGQYKRCCSDAQMLKAGALVQGLVAVQGLEQELGQCRCGIDRSLLCHWW